MVGAVREKAWDEVRVAAVIALGAVLSLIFVGGLVRATGAGLGCPDWPRCWGSWVPPTSAEDIDLERINRDRIPEEFREVEDPRVFFNVRKMWIEYVNRLWGVATGYASIALVFFAVWFRREHPRVLWPAVWVLVLMLFQGWLGSRVVFSGLDQFVLTLHMALAFGILALLVVVSHRAFARRGGGGGGARTTGAEKLRLRRWTMVLLAAVAVQVLVGTEVRSELDSVAREQPELARGEWIDEVGWADHVHRIFSWPVLVLALVVWWRGRGFGGWVSRFGTLALVFVFLQLVLGVSLAYFNLPPASQFLHLGFAACLFAAVQAMWLRAGVSDSHT